MKKLYESTTAGDKSIDKDTQGGGSTNNDDLWGSDFIPLCSSDGESDEEGVESKYIKRMFNFK